MHADFSWVDAYFQKVKPYIYIRLEDMLLIKRPNEVQKLNKSGAYILKELLNGHEINSILKKINATSEKELQVYNFLTAIRQSIESKTDLSVCNPAVIKMPFESAFTQYPVLSEIAITYCCNLKCGFCYAGCNLSPNPINSNAELDTKGLKKIITKIYEQAKVPSVSFTGGEPILRDDLPELITHAKKLGMRVNLISNGTLIDKNKATDLHNAGLDSAQISIEGIDEATHDALTGVKKSFTKAVAAIHYLKNLGIHTHSNTTLNRQNIEQAAHFPLFVKTILGNKKFSMNMMIPVGNVSKNQSLKLLYSEMAEVIKIIIAESKKQEIEFMWYSPLPLCLFNTITNGLGNKGCAACDGLLSVAPTGDVLPCSSFSGAVGNLFKQDFKDFWHKKAATFLREKQFAHEYCKKCEHFILCNGACPLYWKEMGFDELEHIFKT